MVGEKGEKVRKGHVSHYETGPYRRTVHSKDLPTLLLKRKLQIGKVFSAYQHRFLFAGTMPMCHCDYSSTSDVE